MTDSVRIVALRLATALGLTVDPEYFMNDAGWALVAQLEAAMNSNRKLDPIVLTLLEDLTIAMNVRGMEEHAFLRALEAQLGDSPFPPEVISGIARYVRGQLHFAEKRSGVELDPQQATHVPLKSYDFE